MSKRSVRDDHTPTHLGRMFNTVRANASSISDLPPPEEEWSFRDDHIELDKSTRRKLKHRGVIYKTREPIAADDVPALWAVDGDAYAYAQEAAKENGRLSCCGATGITNDAGTIRCIDCGAVVPREEAEEVLR